MLDFYNSIYVLLHCEEFFEKHFESCIVRNFEMKKMLMIIFFKLVMTPLRSLTLMQMMIQFKLDENSSQCGIFTWMNPTLWGIFQKLFKSCIVRNFKVVQVFLTKLDFWNLGRFWWHLWDLCQWCQWWFWSSLTKIPHNVAF